MLIDRRIDSLEFLALFAFSDDIDDIQLEVVKWRQIWPGKNLFFYYGYHSIVVTLLNINPHAYRKNFQFLRLRRS